MSLLWSGIRSMQLLTRLRKPSPTNLNYDQDSARNPEKFHSMTDRFIEGISLFISHSKSRRYYCGDRSKRGTIVKRFEEDEIWHAVFFEEVRAGMTVEASILLPLFLFFFLNLGCAIEIIRLHGNLQTALWEIGNKLSVYGYVLDGGEAPTAEDGEDGWWKDITGIVFASVYVKSRLIDILGKDYLNESPLTKGVDSLQFWESELFGSEDTIDIVVVSSVSPWSRLIGFRPFRMVNRYYSHIWNGYQLPETADENVKTVFVTEHGEVYHSNRNCTYLQLSTYGIMAAELEAARNQYGRRYEPCGKCAKGDRPKEIYITRQGDCFHYSRDCSTLKRTVYEIDLKNAAGYRPCSRCSKQDMCFDEKEMTGK